MNDQISLLLLWMYKLVRQQSNLKLLLTGNLQNIFDETTKQARTGSAWGTESGALNRWGMLVGHVGNTDVFYFGFYFMCPKWTKTKIVIEIALSLQA